MSASQDKKKRQIEAAEGTSKKLSAREAAIKKQKVTRMKWSAVGALVILLIAAIIILNSNLFYTVLPAVTIGDETYSTAEYNYYYQTTYSTFCSENQNLLNYMFDTQKPLDEQAYGDGEMTWADFFEKSAIENMRRISMLNDAAEEAGFELTQEDLDSIEEAIVKMKGMAEEYGYTPEAFVVANYGKGCTYDLVRTHMTRAAVARAYSAQILEGFSYTDAELETYYQENHNTLDYISYCFAYVNGTVSADSEVDAETAMADAKAAAEDIIANAKTPEDLAEKAKTYGISPVNTSAFASTVATYGFGEWMLEEGRTPGETGIVEIEDAGYYAVMFLNRDDNHYKMAKVRQILITAEILEDGGITQENVDAAKAKAEGVLQEWKDGEATEESFAQLVELYSEDSATNMAGGYSDSIIKHMVNDDYDGFCFGDDTQPGDTEIVFVETDEYVGYIILYYVGEGDVYSDHLAYLDLREKDYNAWEEEHVGSYEAKEHFAKRFGK